MKCIGCERCELECFMDVDISGALQALGRVNEGEDLQTVKAEMLDGAKAKGRKPADGCMGCNRCERVCPNRIKIADELKKAVDVFGLLDMNKKVFFY